MKYSHKDGSPGRVLTKPSRDRIVDNGRRSRGLMPPEHLMCGIRTPGSGWAGGVNPPPSTAGGRYSRGPGGHERDDDEDHQRGETPNHRRDLTVPLG